MSEEETARGPVVLDKAADVMRLTSLGWKGRGTEAYLQDREKPEE
jgi:hypothetical protein